MKSILTTFAVGGLLCCTSARAADGCCSNSTTQDKTPPKNVSPALVSIFQVPLRCLAAPQIGCGPLAKPVLLELERDPSVSEAWLNRTGTEIAIVWEVGSRAKARRSVATKLKEHEAVEIKGKPREKATAEFLSGNGWYRGADVDRLSEEEAGTIAARWVRRVEAKTTLSKEKAEALHSALTEALKERLTTMSKEKTEALTDTLKNRPRDDSTKRDLNAFLNSEDGLRKAADQYLDRDQIPILREAIASGVRPLPNEE